MRVSVFGLGYVGCVSAASLARVGHNVIGVETNAEKAALINAGRSPIVEPGLDEVLAEVVTAGRLRATSFGTEAVAATELALVCVGTPSRANGQLSIDALERVAREIGEALRERSEPFTVVLRSTVLPGTLERVFIPALHEGMGGRNKSEVRVAVNPEFMREGTALRDFAAPPLTLVGCQDEATAGLLRELYTGVDAPFVHTQIKTAEMVKYAANAWHALKVCFANEMGDACSALGADAQEVLRVFRLDRKLNISEAYLRPGFAFGGSCLPKDLRALVHAVTRADVTLPLLSSILPANEHQIRQAVDAVLATGKRRVGVVGLAFKAGTDDLRESPMVTLVESLIGKGCQVRILDRHVSIARLVGANRRYIQEEIPHISSLMCQSPRELLDHAETLVIGNIGEEASAVLDDAGPQHSVVDLMRGSVRPRASQQVGA
ncbi:MAG TPA: nucleotide sugar dehydrogenase [Gammaproteobacteria bacterium]|nr:nucleotide sugar dehydrogenase [Gammaproteobacteria bacterium]